MSKRGKQTDYAAELEKSYARWDHLKEYGGSDPFWPDGVSMNLVRNHIIYYKEQLAKQEDSLFALPEAYYRELPPETDCNFMARPDEIREDARKSMERIDSNENLKYVREQSPNLSAQQIKQWCIPAIINYAENLRRAINEDDLVTMRRYRNPERFLESFESAALKIRDPNSTRPINGDLTGCVAADLEDPGDDEELCEDDEQEEAPDDLVGEQQEELQLTLF